MGTSRNTGQCRQETGGSDRISTDIYACNVSAETCSDYITGYRNACGKGGGTNGTV